MSAAALYVWFAPSYCTGKVTAVDATRQVIGDLCCCSARCSTHPSVQLAGLVLVSGSTSTRAAIIVMHRRMLHRKFHMQVASCAACWSVCFAQVLLHVRCTLWHMCLDMNYCRTVCMSGVLAGTLNSSAWPHRMLFSSKTPWCTAGLDSNHWLLC